MPTINLGRVSLVPKGEWSSSEPYKRLDLVTYNDAAYICEVAHTDVIPSASAPEWTLILEVAGSDVITSLQATQTQYEQKLYPSFIEDRGDGQPFSYPAGFIVWYDDGGSVSGYFKAQVEGTSTLPTDVTEWVPYDLSSASGATGGSGDQIFHENDIVVKHDYTLERNAVTAGPIQIGDPKTLTLLSSDGSNVSGTTGVDHGLSIGDSVTIRNTTNYNGDYTITTVPTSTTFTITSTLNVADETSGEIEKEVTVTIADNANWTVV